MMIPVIRIVINLITVIDHLIKFIDLIVVIKGNIITISTSKMMKIIAIKKNCIENDKRALLKKLNPHSNGVAFSLILLDFFDKINVIAKRITEIVKVTKAATEITNI